METMVRSKDVSWRCGPPTESQTRHGRLGTPLLSLSISLLADGAIATVNIKYDFANPVPMGMTRRELERLLDEADDLFNKGEWKGARKVLQRATDGAHANPGR